MRRSLKQRHRTKKESSKRPKPRKRALSLSLSLSQIFSIYSIIVFQQRSQRNRKPPPPPWLPPPLSLLGSPLSRATPPLSINVNLFSNGLASSCSPHARSASSSPPSTPPSSSSSSPSPSTSSSPASSTAGDNRTLPMPASLCCPSPPSPLWTDLLFKLALAISSLLAASFAILLVLALTGRLSRSQWQLAEATFLLLQFLSHLAAAALIAHEKRFRAATHPTTLRLFWIASVLLTALLSASAVVRFVVAVPISPDDVISLVALSLPLLFLAVSGSTGISADHLPPEGEHPTGSGLKHPQLNVTPYATAALLSRIMVEVLGVLHLS